MPPLGLRNPHHCIISESLNFQESCRKAREWWARAEALQKPENYPYLDTLEALVTKGKPLPVRLDPLQQLETQVKPRSILTRNLSVM